MLPDDEFAKLLDVLYKRYDELKDELVKMKGDFVYLLELLEKYSSYKNRN